MRDSALATRRILVPGRTCWAVSPQASAGLLVDGREYFRAFYRAAGRARRFILLAGWQFDAHVPLLRGEDAAEAWTDPRLLPFLRALLVRNPQLEIRILCWDYSPAFFFQREWFQDCRFNWSSPSRLQFRFDDRHAVGASHHQKFVVIDGALAFTGSMDLCKGRWDERRHVCRCDARGDLPGEDRTGPFHEVQAAVTGPVVADFSELFRARWRSSGGGDLGLPPAADDWDAPPACSVRIAGREAGLSRTVARTLVPGQPSIREIRQLYCDAIASAERSIYLENQYFSSSAVFEALRARLAERYRPPLQIAFVLPSRFRSVTEEWSMAATQDRMFRCLKREAAEFGHRLGIYYGSSAQADGRESGRYIHSKVLIVDDRFLTVGSANTNNRSMGLDTELNISWEADPGEDDLLRSIRRARVSLLAEHASVRSRRELIRLYDDGSMVDVLNAWSRRKPCGLRPLPVRDTPGDLVPGPFEFDPERPVVEEDVFERVAPSRRDWVRSGIHRIRRRVMHVSRRRRVFLAVDPPSSLSRRPVVLWHGVARWSRRMLVPALVVAVALVVAGLLRIAFLAGLSLFRSE